MTFKQHTSRFRTIRQNDPDFMLHDDMMVSPRAGIEISQRCPENYRSLIQECVDHGWLRPIATVYDYELTFDKLAN